MQRSRTESHTIGDTKPTICMTGNPNFRYTFWTHGCAWLRSSCHSVLWKSSFGADLADPNLHPLKRPLVCIGVTFRGSKGLRGIFLGPKCLALCAWTSVPWGSQQNTERILVNIYLHEGTVECCIPQLKWLMSENLWSKFLKSWQPHLCFCTATSTEFGLARP